MVLPGSNALVLVFLPHLEFDLEVVFCKRVEDFVGFALDLDNGIKTVTLELHFHLGDETEVHRC